MPTINCFIISLSLGFSLLLFTLLGSFTAGPATDRDTAKFRPVVPFPTYAPAATCAVCAPVAPCAACAACKPAAPPPPSVCPPPPACPSPAALAPGGAAAPVAAPRSGRLRTEAARGLGVPPNSDVQVPESKIVPGASGQAGVWSDYGRRLKALCQEPDVELVLELGTWNGGGSSRALALGLLGGGGGGGKPPDLSGTSKLLVTMEPITPMFDTAKELLSGLPVRLIHGTSVLAEELPTADEIAHLMPGIPRAEWEQWLASDVAGAKQFKVGMLQPLCALFEWDLVHIDAGEFAGYREWQIVNTVCKPRYVAFHDTHHLKTKRSVEEARKDNATWALLDSSEVEPGWAIFKRVKMD